MPLIAIKLFSTADDTTLESAIATYQAGAGSQLVTDQRGMDVDVYYDPVSGKYRHFAALAWGGQDIPVSKLGDQQFLACNGNSLAAAQTAVDAELANVIHAVRADGNANSNPGDIVVGASCFEVEDVGRKITIGSAVRTITAYVSATRVTYSGAAITGTGLTVKLHGAEVLQKLSVAAFREPDGDPHFVVAIATGGQIA